jgi:hypothetical protein
LSKLLKIIHHIAAAEKRDYEATSKMRQHTNLLSPFPKARLKRCSPARGAHYSDALDHVKHRRQQIKQP